MLRESRGSRGRLLFFVTCLAVGVAAVVAVAGLSSSLQETIRSRARELIAADVSVSSRRPLPADLDGIVRSTGMRRTDVKELTTLAAAPSVDGLPGRSQLVELKAVDRGYPFYGELRLDPARPADELLDPQHALVAPLLLSRLGLRVGDSLRIGSASFEVAGLVLSEPDRVEFSLTLGPRVLVSPGGLARADLERFGSLVEHRALLAAPAGASASDVAALAERIRIGLDQDAAYVRVETFADAQAGLREGLRRVESFLGLVALLSLVVGGVGVAQVVRAWLAGRVDAIAVQKCLGMRPRELGLLYLGQSVLLGLAGSLAGVVAGSAVQAAVPPLSGGLLPVTDLRVFQPGAAGRGILLGVAVAVLFSLPPLLALRRIPPARVLQRAAQLLPESPAASVVVAVLLAAGTWLIATWQARSPLRGAIFVGGLAFATDLLALAAWTATLAIDRWGRGRTRVWLRHGLSAPRRPGAATLGAVVAIGLGVLVVVATYRVQDQLADRLRVDLPADAPTAFIVDIQPDQWAGVQATLEAEGARSIRSVPVVMGRLRAIDGRTVTEILADAERSSGRGRRGSWPLTREQRLSYMRELPEDNRIIEGAPWSEPERHEVSVEREFASDLGVGVGARLTFDVQGRPLDLWVSSIRTVDWESFGINFFLVVEPGVLEGAPQFRVATASFPAGAEERVQDRLAADFPNVTVLNVREILDKVADVLGRIGLGVRLLGGFTVLAGIVILAGAISAGAVRRGREVALLKTLGMTRRGVVAVYTVEYALVGLIAGAIGSIGGATLAWAVLAHVMDMPLDPAPWSHVTAIAASGVLTVAAGLAASVPALARRPIELLRQE